MNFVFNYFKFISNIVLINLKYIKCLKSGIYYKIHDLLSDKWNKPTIFLLGNEINYNNPKKCLNIMTYNIDGPFFHFNYNNYLNISKFIRQQFFSNNIDIISLQEVWLTCISDLIMKELYDLDLYVSFPPTTKKYNFGEHSGLMIISKYPILTNEYIEFDNCSFTCNMTRKGLQHITINHNNEIVNIINTHLQSSFKDFNNLHFHSTASKQLDIIQKYCLNNCIYNYMIIGDLNMDTMYIKKYLIDNKNISMDYNPEYKNICSFPSTQETLDYCLFCNIFNENIVEYELFKNIDYSDHLPLLIKISNNE